MNTKTITLSPVKAIKQGWAKVKQQLGLWTGISALVLAPNIIGGLFEPAEGEPYTLVASLIVFIMSVVSALFSLGLIKAGLDANDKNEKVEFSDIWSVMDKRLISIIGAYFLTFLIFIIPMALIFAAIFGMVFFELPIAAAIILGIIGFVAMVVVAIRLYFVQYAIIDSSMTAVGAIKHSFAITKSYEFTLIGFGLLIGLLNFLTIFTLFLGLLVTIPITTVASAYLYRKLSGQPIINIPTSAAHSTETNDDQFIDQIDDEDVFEKSSDEENTK